MCAVCRELLDNDGNAPPMFQPVAKWSMITGQDIKQAKILVASCNKDITKICREISIEKLRRLREDKDAMRDVKRSYYLRQLTRGVFRYRMTGHVTEHSEYMFDQRNMYRE